jgi:hypothetical protein
MHSVQISDLFRVQGRFLRSAHLERDFADPKALHGYVLTPQTREYIERLATGLRLNSGQRAWRITGDYGSGKSSFALLLAHLFGEQHARLPEHLRQAINFRKLGVSRPHLLPVLVTGSHEPLAVGLLRALRRDLLTTCGRGRPPVVIEQIDVQLKGSLTRPVPDQAVVQLLSEACSHVVGSGKGSGVLLLLDELGKFLEYGALHPERQDVFLLQALAEAACRSTQAPLFIVGLLHQGFSAYAEHLSQSAQKEWEKVAGRFDEVVFNQPLEQTAILVADALNIRLAELQRSVIARSRHDMGAIVDLGWYGAAATKSTLMDTSSRLYPLHPTVVPVLVKLFSRFGQNERSLFSFLLSNEPFGLKEFALQSVGADRFYRIHNLYDYARYSFGHRLGREGFRSHWNHIDSLVESFPVEHERDLQLLKTVGLLNLLDSANLLPSEDVLLISISGEEAEVKASIRRLKEKRVVYYRGVAGGYCLWPHTSVNLEKAYDDAVRALGRVPHRVTPLIDPYLETRPLVARRHYIETGNLRHFDVCFCPVETLSTELAYDVEKTDGRILIALCETEEERGIALQFARSDVVQTKGSILCAIPSPLRVLAKLVQQVQRWEWVVANTPELVNDSFATEEVSRQLAAARDALQQRLNCFIGVHHFTGRTELTWFRKGQEVKLKRGRELLSYLSNVCDEIYPSAPRVANELVNRRTLSSAAAAARMRLIEGIFSASSKPYLGMDSAKKRPEMSLYLSILKRGGLHKKQDKDKDDWRLAVPSTNHDTCNVGPALRHIQSIFDARNTQRVRVSEILSELKRPPFGIRDGLAPVLVALYAAMNEQHAAFYNNGVFMREIVGLDAMRLTKVPEAFEIQYCKVAGVRTELFERLLKILDLKRGKTRDLELLDVVRPLCVFAAELPPFTQKTKRLSPNAVAVRSALLSAREPALLLFRDLPAACGFGEFTSDKHSGSKKDVDLFVASLKNAISELRMAYPVLHENMKAALIDAFGLPSGDDFRVILSLRAQQLSLAVTEPKLKAFCNRLLDTELPEPEWLESLGSLVCSIPPARWADVDLERYSQELPSLCTRLGRVETMCFEAHKDRYVNSAMRLSITQLDGTEADRIVYVSRDQESSIAEIESRLADVLKDSPQLAFVATARVLWKALSQESKNE